MKTALIFVLKMSLLTAMITSNSASAAQWPQVARSANSKQLLGSTYLTRAENDRDVIYFSNCRAGVAQLQVQVRAPRLKVCESIFRTVARKYCRYVIELPKATARDGLTSRVAIAVFNLSWWSAIPKVRASSLE